MGRGLMTMGACGLAALLMAGCLLKDTTETWYVDASGTVTWSVTEKDVRSDANAMPDRLQEESIYWLAVQQQRHPVAAGLQELGGANLRTRVIRGESPYTVVTDARFSGLDELGRRILAATGGMGDSSVTRAGANWEWKFIVRDPSASGSVSEPTEGVSTLMNDMEALKVVLLAGRFESSEGFELSNDRRVATLVTKDVKATASHDQPEEPAITLRLAWK
jgi:hypothetical protein